MVLKAREVWVFLILVIFVVSALAYGFVFYQPPKPATSVPVGAVLYLWYGYGPAGPSGRNSAGWNVTGGNSTGGFAVVDEPAIGYYVSDSNSTFQLQVQEMERAGLSYAVVSWWGNASSGRDGAVNRATLDLFKYLKGTNSTFRIAVMVDAYNGSNNLSGSAYKEDYDYVYSSFVEPYGNWYFDWQGKPLLMFFGPLVPGMNDSRFAVRTIGNYNSQPADSSREPDWIFWTAPSQFYQDEGGSGVNYTNDLGNPVVSSDGEVTIVPRIDSYYYYLGDPQHRGFLQFDSNLSLGLYQDEWTYVIQHKDEIGMVLIYSWNEYYERSAIEPHIEPSGEPSPLVNYTSSYSTLLDAATAGRFDLSQEIRSACTYLASNYVNSSGLIAETPSHARYYLYSDNYLATLILPKDCNSSSLAMKIDEELSRYDSSAIPNQYMVFGCKLDFQGTNDYALSGDIWTTVNNQSGAPLDGSYADIAFLQAYYDARCGQNASRALEAFSAGGSLYDGVGFNDTPFRVGGSRGVHQTYKLALYIYTAALLGQTVPLNALADLLLMQTHDGGFYTGYDASLSRGGATTNTETTCLAIMALESVSV